MKIFLVDKKTWFLVTCEEAKAILNSGLKPEDFTRENIQQYLIH